MLCKSFFLWTTRCVNLGTIKYQIHQKIEVPGRQKVITYQSILLFVHVSVTLLAMLIFSIVTFFGCIFYWLCLCLEAINIKQTYFYFILNLLCFALEYSIKNPCEWIDINFRWTFKVCLNHSIDSWWTILLCVNHLFVSWWTTMCVNRCIVECQITRRLGCW